MASVSLYLPDDVFARLQQLAELTGRSKTFYIAKAWNQPSLSYLDFWRSAAGARCQTAELESVLHSLDSITHVSSDVDNELLN